MKKEILCVLIAVVFLPRAEAQVNTYMLNGQATKVGTTATVLNGIQDDTIEGTGRVFRSTQKSTAGGAYIEQIYNDSHVPNDGNAFKNILLTSGAYGNWAKSDSSRAFRKISALVKASDFSFYASPDPRVANDMDGISARFVDRKTLDVSVLSKSPLFGFQRYTLTPATYERYMLFNLVREVESTYVLFSMYIVPENEVPPDLQGKLPFYVDYGGFMAFTLNEAEIVDGNVVLGEQLTSGKGFDLDGENSGTIALDKKQLRSWSSQGYMYAGPLDPGPWSLGNWGVLGVLWRETKPDPWGVYPPKVYADAATSPVAYLEDVVIPVVEPTETHRVRRCAGLYDWVGGAFYQFVQMVRGRGHWDYLGSDPCPTSDSDLIPVVETQPTSTPLLTLVDSQTTAVANDDSFAAAMNYQVCLDRPETDVDEGVCTTTERAELTTMAELSFTEIQSAITAITAYLDEAAVGAGSARLPTTSSASLNAIITSNPEHALGLLNNAARIAYSSGAGETPSAPIAPRADSSKGKKKRKGVGAAVCTTKTPDASDGFECVQRGVRKRRPVTEQTDVVSVPAQVSNSGRYYRPSDASYNALARAVVNSGVGLPFGMTQANFNSGSGYIAAMAYDGARIGQGMSVVYLPNVTGQQGDTSRFGYGLQHIWTTRTGGHRNEWETLGVTSSAMLTDLIMSALVSHGPVEITRDPQRPTNQRRNYASVSFNYAGQTYFATNVIIVVSDNGMVITAYPSTNRRNPSTLTKAKAELKR
ncbi:hypothetical protein ABU614_16985 [Lysobacter firmicutimachus]|uniref:Uncharacterized protein n=1 Tax=Lysobacter firmicutimachus TaxID=1792846 RepID=A0AAU8MS48_9GAMM